MDKQVPNIISKWIQHEVVRETIEQQQTFYTIIGVYQHTEDAEPRKSVGVCWNNYPKSRNGKIAVMAVPDVEGIALLLDILKEQVANNHLVEIDKITSFIKELKNETSTE